MSAIKEIRCITTFEYVRETPLNTKYLDAFIQIGEKLGAYYLVKYKSGVTNSFGDFSSLPKRARRIVKHSYSFATKYVDNSEIKIWEC